MLATPCDTCAARSHSFCGILTKDEISHLNSMSRRKRIRAGEVIVDEERQTGYVANITSGVVKLTKTLVDGRQLIVGLQFSGDFLGQPLGGESGFRAEAATEVELCMFTMARFERLMCEFPGIEHRLFQQTLNALDAARAWMVVLGRKTATEKVASFLDLLASRISNTPCSGSPSVRFELPLTRAEIADCLGLTIETVSRAITRLKVMGLIVLVSNRTIVVPSKRALRAVSECFLLPKSDVNMAANGAIHDHAENSAPRRALASVG
jgi:CRP/FNR family transcriptional regulator, anaerobic regulatory protein